MPKLFNLPFLVHPALYVHVKGFSRFPSTKSIQHLISTEMPEFLIFRQFTLHWHHVVGYVLYT
jgi:hypothetical protein